MAGNLTVGLAKALSVLAEMRSQGIIGEYAVGGAIAAFIYIEPSFTADIDVFVVLDSVSLDPLRPIIEWLRARGHATFENEGILIAGWTVQFVPATTPLEREALAQAITIDLEKVPTRIFSQEHLMALCLDLGRPKDQARLASFLQTKSYDERLLIDILSRFDLAAKWAASKFRMS